METGEREQQPAPGIDLQLAGEQPEGLGPTEPDHSRGRGKPFGVGLSGLTWGPVAVLLGGLIAFGAMAVLTVPIAFLDPDLESTAAEVAAQLTFVAALMIGAVAIVVSRSRGLLAAFRSLGFHRPGWGVLGWSAIAYCIYIAAAIALAMFLSPEQEDLARGFGADEEGPWGLIAAGFLIVVCAPLAEEVFFRGFLYGGLRRALGVLPAALLSAVLFGVAHLATGNVAVAVQLAVFGFVAAGLYEYRGNLWGPIALHTVNNSIAFVVLVTDAA